MTLLCITAEGIQDNENDKTITRALKPDIALQSTTYLKPIAVKNQQMLNLIHLKALKNVKKKFKRQKQSQHTCEYFKKLTNIIYQLKLANSLERRNSATEEVLTISLQCTHRNTPIGSSLLTNQHVLGLMMKNTFGNM